MATGRLRVWSTPCLTRRTRPCICVRVRLALSTTWSIPRAITSGRGETSVAQSPNGQSGNQSSVAPSSDLGANEWLVEEMKEQYDKDPGSVGPEWASYFGNGSAAPARAASTKTQTTTAAPVTSQAPAKAPAKAPSQAAKAPEKAPEKAPVKAATSTPRPKAAADEPAKGSSAPVAKDPKPAAPSPADDGPTYTVLRGAPARTAANMDASLSVPTATSVRSVPVKLLWDNRTVINNHLARARGGKVSFTHIIGYALVKALRSMPEMNVGFEVRDGKPNLITPAHINLGLAIDMQKPDGTRQLLVPNIKGAETMDFAGFWTAYEEIVRKARDNKLGVVDFQGTTMSLTNPGGIGTVHSVPRLMAGQGAIIGVGAMEPPRGGRAPPDGATTHTAIKKSMPLPSTNAPR